MQLQRAPLPNLGIYVGRYVDEPELVVIADPAVPLQTVLDWLVAVGRPETLTAAIQLAYSSTSCEAR